MKNLNEFINEIVEKINDQYNDLTEKLLIFDIINIYKGNYYTYNAYINSIELINKYIDMQEKMFVYNAEFKVNMTLQPKHTIISENLFNYIMELRKRDKENK